ncbi:MAG: helix-turn-helix domain-containing protein [Cyclobacteriaceae bacterium]|nr:helix-turn-helix domain-containing protein [Cyclobacteriaceae bacterium SS2]
MEVDSNIIRELRKVRNLSQEEFSKIIGVSLRTFQKYESGQHKIPDPIRKLIKYRFYDSSNTKPLELETFGIRLSRLMNEHGYNPNKLSIALGVHASTVANYLNNSTKPNNVIVDKLADFFKVTRGWLLTGESESKTDNQRITGQDIIDPGSFMAVPGRLKRYIELLEKENEKLHKRIEFLEKENKLAFDQED